METRVTDQACFILRRREWRNSSLILELFSRDHGCVKVLARGARRGSSKVPYQPFVMLSVNWVGQQELKTLAGIEGQVLPIAETNYLSLLYINELIGALLPPAEANPEVFAAYLRLLQQAVVRLEEGSLREFELELMQNLGLMPDLQTEAENGQPIQSGRYYQFVVNRGFTQCAQTDANVINGDDILTWNRSDYSGESVRRLAKSVLRTTIDFNLHGKTLKSREIYSQIMRRQ